VDGAIFQLAIAFDQINVTLRDDIAVNVFNMNRRLHAAQRLMAEATGFLSSALCSNIGGSLAFHRYFHSRDVPSRRIKYRMRQEAEDKD
jgi:hypothetical protein